MYRARAHSNPLNDANFNVPAHPDDYDWCVIKAAMLIESRHALPVGYSLTYAPFEGFMWADQVPALSSFLPE